MNGKYRAQGQHLEGLHRPSAGLQARRSAIDWYRRQWRRAGSGATGEALVAFQDGPVGFKSAGLAVGGSAPLCTVHISVSFTIPTEILAANGLAGKCDMSIECFHLQILCDLSSQGVCGEAVPQTQLKPGLVKDVESSRRPCVAFYPPDSLRLLTRPPGTCL